MMMKLSDILWNFSEATKLTSRDDTGISQVILFLCLLKKKLVDIQKKHRPENDSTDKSLIQKMFFVPMVNLSLKAIYSERSLPCGRLPRPLI